VLVDGSPLQPVIDGRTWHLRLPPAARGIRLVSRAWVPAHTRSDEDDTRTLGVGIDHLRFDAASVAQDDPSWSSGWHGPEADVRWTDGDAALAVTGVRDLAFDLVMTGSYWKPPRRDRRARAARTA
jgi:hypothetical protein